MPTKFSITLLKPIEAECLRTIIQYFFSRNVMSLSFEEITDAFYRVEYYIPANFNDETDEIIVSKYEHGAESRKISDFPMPLLRKSVNTLIANGFLAEANIKIDYEDSPLFELAPEFVDLAHELYHQKFDFFIVPTSSNDQNGIPAADRFVSIHDNEPVIVEAKEALTALSMAIRGANDLFATQEDRIQISEEINYLHDIISKPKLHFLTVWDFAKNNHVLKALADQTKSDFVKQTAQLVLLNLDKIVTFLWSCINKN